MKYLIYILTVSLCFSFAKAQSNELVNREAFNLKLAVDSINFYKADIPSSPIVNPDNSVQIYPGEKLFLEFELNGQEIKSIKSVKDILNPNKTITIEFVQETESKIHQRMMLTIENPFQLDLTYSSIMFLQKNNKWVETTVLPVRAGKSTFEIWPDIIISLALMDWKFEKSIQE